MPLGEIKPRALTPEETRWRDRWARYEGWLITDLAVEVKHWHRKEFFAFMYAMDPRIALVLSQEPTFRDVLAYQRDKNFLQEFRDHIWRRFDDWKNTR